MKTKDYNIGKGLVTVAITILICSFGIAAENSHKNPAPAKYSESATFDAHEASMDAKFEMLTETLHDWMSKGSYWETEDENTQNITMQDNEKDQNRENNLAASLKSWMTSGSYWNSEDSSPNEL